MKALLELNLDTSVKDNRKCFYEYISNIRMAKGTFQPLLDVKRNIATKHKAEQLMPLLPQSSTERWVINHLPELADGNKIELL